MILSSQENLMSNRFLSLLVLILICCSSLLSAQTLAYKTPEGWEKQEKEGGIHTLSPIKKETGKVVLIFVSAPADLGIVSPEKELAAANRNFAKALGEPIDDNEVEVKETSKGRYVCVTKVKHASGQTLTVTSIGILLSEGRAQAAHLCFNTEGANRYKEEIAAFTKSLRKSGAKSEENDSEPARETDKEKPEPKTDPDSPASGSAIRFTLPKGWKRQNQNGVTLLAPTGLEKTDVLFVLLNSPLALKGVPLEKLMSPLAEKIVQPLGKLIGSPEVETLGEGGYRAEAKFKGKQIDKTCSLTELGYELPGENCQMVFIIGEPKLLAKYKSDLDALKKSFKIGGTSPTKKTPAKTDEPPIKKLGAVDTDETPKKEKKKGSKQTAEDDTPNQKEAPQSPTEDDATPADPPEYAKSALPGWKSSKIGSWRGFEPPDVAEGEFFQIRLTSLMDMKGRDIADFLDDFIAKNLSRFGKSSDRGAVAQAKDHFFSSCVRNVATPSGEKRFAIFFALTTDAKNAKVMALFSSAKDDLLKRYQPASLTMLKAVKAADKKEAQEDGRGVAKDELPTTPAGMKPGGKITPGIYAGNVLYNGEINIRYRVYLYDNFDALVCDENGKEREFGADKFTYDKLTGRLSVGRTHYMNNGSYEPDSNFCLYGRDAQGKPYIQGCDGSRTFVLRYAGPADRPSPQETAEAEKAAEEESKRYKLVVPAGQGVKNSEIAGVLHHYETKSNGGGVAAEEEVYLLLKDGTIRDGLPVPPDELDASKSRRKEPEKWGTWRREGKKILASWHDRPNHYEPLKGDFAIPGKPGELLTGRFGSGETSGYAITGTSYRLWGVTFSKDGKFVKDERGGSSNGSLAQINGTSIFTSYDDDGSVVSADTPGVVVSNVKKKKRGSDRSGSYQIDGYALILRFDNGKVKRYPFFFGSGDKTLLYFEGASLSLDEKK